MEGKYCDRLNSKGLQTIAAFIIIVVSGTLLIIYDLREKFIKLLNYFYEIFSKNLNYYSKRDTRKTMLYNFSSNLKDLFSRFLKNIAFYIIMIVLTGFQIIFIHLFKLTFKKSLSEFRSNSTALNFICTNLEYKYLSEELIYSALSILLVTFLITTNKPKRFSNYIMKKYKIFFQTQDLYGKLIQNQKELLKQDSKKYVANMKPCQRRCFEMKNKCLFKIICCPCTCCMNKDSKINSCVYSCCCIPFRRAKLCKYLNAIKQIFCCLKSCCCYGCKQGENSDDDKEKKEMEKDEDELRHLENDKELLNSENKLSLKWLIPISPFSSSKCKQAIAVYVAYTYDILNIFMYLYASYLVLPIIPIVRKKEGVLVDFVIQIFQVFLIGFKFYPLLSITDLNANALTYFFVLLYVSIIFVLKTINKGLCSRTEVFVKFTLDKLNDQFHISRIRKLHSSLNFTNLLYNSENEFKYEELFYKNPSLLDELFGRSDSADLEFLARGEIPFDDDTVNEVLSNRMGTTLSMAVATVSSTLSTLTQNNKPMGFRREKKPPFQNDSTTYLSEVMDGFSNDEEKELKVLVRNLLENLPLYLSLSYLVATYLVAFLSSVLKKFKRKSKDFDNDDKKKIDDQSFEILTRELLEKVNFESGEFIYKHFDNKYSKSVKNRHYNYIANIFSSMSVKQNNSKRPFIRKLFKNEDRYFQYSKQYITTYTVAFMVIYFFTVFLFRMANIFGNTVIRAIELMYQFITSGIQQSHIFQNVSLNNELKTASVVTTIISTLQLIYSIKAFKKRVMSLNRGELKAKSLLPHKNNKGLFVNNKNKYTAIASQSLHFPGYLIAHLVYGYLILLCTVFILILFFKIVWNFPLIWDKTTQLFLPLIVMVLFKLVFIRIVMCTAIECQGTNYRIKNLTAYFTLSYFNFFFDCFLGFMSCINRIWQTTIISCLYVSRLDVSIFNDNNEIIIQNLDKGHLAYINFAYMEHLYNNQVINGFCDVLLELLFKSVMKSDNYTDRIYIAKRRLHSIVFVYYAMKQFPSLKGTKYSRKSKTNDTGELFPFQKKPLKRLYDENYKFDYEYIQAIVHDKDYNIENFSINGINEIALMKFLNEKKDVLHEFEMQLKKLNCFHENKKETKSGSISSCSDELPSSSYKNVPTPMNSNSLWSMVSTCLIGNSSLNPLLRLMTCYKLLQLKYEFYKLIEKKYLNAIDDSLTRYNKVNADFLQLLYNSRNYDKYGDKLHFHALSSVLGKKIVIYLRHEDSFVGLKDTEEVKSEVYEPLSVKSIGNDNLNKVTLYGSFYINRNHYYSLIPYKK